MFQKECIGSRPIRMSKMYCCIKCFGCKVEWGKPRRHIDRHIWVPAREFWQARHQPSHSKGRQDGEIQTARERSGLQFQRRLCNAIKRLADVIRIGRGLGCQRQSLAITQDQLHPDLSFQRLQLPTDGTLCPRQFTRRSRGAAKAIKRLKRAE